LDNNPLPLIRHMMLLLQGLSRSSFVYVNQGTFDLMT
jgi:hypothetical protein